MTDKIDSRVKNLEKKAQVVYENLSPERRLKLHIEAKVAGNDWEVKQLEKSCPRKTYLMCEEAMVNRKEAFDTLLVTTVMDLSSMLQKVNLLDAFLQYFVSYQEQAQNLASDNFAAGWGASGSRYDETFEMALNKFDEQLGPSKIFSGTFLKDMESLIDQHKRNIKARWEAFGEICRELVKVEPEIAIAFYDTAEELDGLADILDEDAQISSERHQEYVQMMRKLWHQELGGT